MFTTFLPNVPQLFVDVDRDKVLKQGVEISQVYQTLQSFMGGYFVNYFNRFGRTWQVYVEAEGDYRTDANNVRQILRPQSRTTIPSRSMLWPPSGTMSVRSSPCVTTPIAMRADQRRPRTRL